MMQRQREAEEQALTAKNQIMRNEQKNAIKAQQATKYALNHNDAVNIKGERQQHEEMIQI